MNKGMKAFFRSCVLGSSLASLLCLSAGAAQAGRPTHRPAPKTPDRFATYANPMDLPYRYQTTSRASFREAADPTMIFYNKVYWLFPSHSKGYFYSKDMNTWTFVEGSGYAVDRYAPTVVEIKGKLYMATSDSSDKIWSTDDPFSGQWHQVATMDHSVGDPCLFLDDDGRLYLYSGLGGNQPLSVEELDPVTFKSIRSRSVTEVLDSANRGWQVNGDDNDKYTRKTFYEGSWMNKYKGKYYLQHAAPGTEQRSYADGVLVSDNPMGPFTYLDNNPFSFKPTGFIAGAGHGSTFRGIDGQWWHIATGTLSQRFIFERRLSLFPAAFTPAGNLTTDTYLGDYPRYLAGNRALTGWMVLSRHKAVTASSNLQGHDVAMAADENIQTWWSAQTGNAGEWFQMDLGERKSIEAVQINFADQDGSGSGISHDVYNYRLDVSDDGQSWRPIVDASKHGRDAPHDYRVLPKAEQARYVRLTNVHMPEGAKFSLFDLRVFGHGNGPLAGRVAQATTTRDAADARIGTVTWKPTAHADFYVVRFGTSPQTMTHNYQVYDGQTSLTVRSLTKGEHYVVAVDAINDSGITKGAIQIMR